MGQYVSIITKQQLHFAMMNTLKFIREHKQVMGSIKELNIADLYTDMLGLSKCN